MQLRIGIVLVAASAALTGCAIKAPNYNASPASTQALQAARVQPATVGEFTAAPTVNNKSISLRASTMEAPQGTFSQYLADAVKTELDLVKLYSPTAATEISGTLLRNDLDTGVALKGNGAIEARFMVRRAGAVRFDKTKSAVTEWDSNFIGAIAIPRAHQEYARLVQALVSQLFEDPEFVAALK